MNVTGREPVVLWMAIVTPLIQLVSAFIFPLNDEQQGVLNGAFAVVLGFVAMLAVSVDRALPMLAGVVQALIAVGLAFGMDLDPETQTAILAVVAGLVGFFVRTQVSPKVTPAAVSAAGAPRVVD